MIVPFARAVQGFIPVVDAPNLASTDNFIQCLQKIMTFESIDIQDFDGNTCRIISSEDPTNSIFIYTNDTGTYLYQVVKASPVLHKNKKIWLCDTYEMEDVAKINDILTNDTKFIFYKNLFCAASPSIDNAEYKGNFEKIENFALAVSGDSMCLKIKCMTNPTTENLTSYAEDGSFNFFFPLFRVGNKWQTTIRFIYAGVGHDLSIKDIVSKYSPNIRSIEIIPFYPKTANEMGGGYFGSYNWNVLDNIAEIVISGTARYTDCGAFIAQGHSDVGNGTIYNRIVSQYFNRQLVKGGGVRGFVKTPLGNIELDFSKTKNSTTGDLGAFECILLDDGWAISGFAKAKIPPHFINFYTDNAGQVFIQNLTTNAQELRSLERQVVAKQEERQLSYENKQIGAAFNAGVGVLSGALNNGVLGAIGGVLSGAKEIAQNAFENEFERQKINRDYSRSLVEYRDKIETQSLLASMQGKQVSGNVNLSDFLKYVDFGFFEIVIESNFAMVGAGKNYYVENGQNVVDQKYLLLTQNDFDYSTSAAENHERTTSLFGNISIRNEDYSLLKKSSRPGDSMNVIMRAIFGYSNHTNEDGTIFDCIDKVGLTYSIVFSLSNYITDYSTQLPSNLKFSKILNFPIRRNKKILSYRL